MAEHCPVCKSRILNKEKAHDYQNAHHIKCNNCGEYKITYTASSMLKYQKLKYTASSWIRNENDNGNIPMISEFDIDRLKNIHDKSLDAKYKILLMRILKEEEKCEQVYFRDKNDLLKWKTICWCKNVNEFVSLVDEAKKLNHIDLLTIGNEYHIRAITFSGRKYIETEDNINSNKVFMAFHFTDEMKRQFEDTIKRAVSDASENKLEAIRVSSSTTDYDTKIDDELIAMIKSSKAVIADFTGNRTAVYYEAGFAMGLGIPVIWTCKDSDIPKGEIGYGEFTDEKEIKRFKKHIDLLSFDTRQYPHIIWKDKEDLYKQVVNRLKAKIL